MFRWIKTFWKFGIYHPRWVTNGERDPSTDKIFHRGPPASTWWHSTRSLSDMGLNGYYRVRT